MHWQASDILRLRAKRLRVEGAGMDQIYRSLREERDALREALSTLYAETADYIRTNHLGDVHHNRSMQLALDVLSKSR
jgi:hypothetical protein